MFVVYRRFNYDNAIANDKGVNCAKVYDRVVVGICRNIGKGSSIIAVSAIYSSVW